MIRSLNGKTPKIADSVFVSEAAYIIGDVEIDEDSSIWPGAIIRADFGKIKIGKECAIEDNCVLHAAPSSLIIGDNVHIGHGAVVNCHKIGDRVLIGINSTLLHESEIGNRCIIGANCLILREMKVPDGSFVAGVPGEIVGEASPQQLWWVTKGSSRYAELAKQYKKQGL